MAKHNYKNSPEVIKTCNMQNLIKTLRTSQHMTQQELAKKLGITQQEISKLEHSNVHISLNTLATLCTQLDVAPFITFSSNTTIVLLDTQLINSINTLRTFSSDKQQIIYELIRLLS